MCCFCEGLFEDDSFFRQFNCRRGKITLCLLGVLSTHYKAIPSFHRFEQSAVFLRQRCVMGIPITYTCHCHTTVIVPVCIVTYIIMQENQVCKENWWHNNLDIQWQTSFIPTDNDIQKILVICTGNNFKILTLTKL